MPLLLLYNLAFCLINLLTFEQLHLSCLDLLVNSLLYNMNHNLFCLYQLLEHIHLQLFFVLLLFHISELKAYDLYNFLNFLLPNLLNYFSGEERVFQLPSHSYCLRMLNEWTRKAGIRKHISFHCARHTFITNLMASGANIKTAASLAGHSSTRHTEKYIHIIDTQKQQAVDNLPPLPFD